LLSQLIVLQYLLVVKEITFFSICCEKRADAFLASGAFALYSSKVLALSGELVEARFITMVLRRFFPLSIEIVLMLAAEEYLRGFI